MIRWAFYHIAKPVHMELRRQLSSVLLALHHTTPRICVEERLKPRGGIARILRAVDVYAGDQETKAEP